MWRLILPALLLSSCAPISRSPKAVAPSPPSKWDAFGPEPTFEPGPKLPAAQRAARPVLDDLLRRLSPPARAKVEVRQRVCDLADHLLYLAQREPDLDLRGTLDRLTHLHGLPAELRSAQIQTISPDDPQPLATMSQGLEDAVAQERRAWVCLASRRWHGQIDQVAFVHLGGLVDLAPLPRQYTRGGTVAVDLELAISGRAPPEVLLDGDNGAVLAVQASPRATAGAIVQRSASAPTRYFAALPVEASPGWIWLNVDVDRGDTRTLALALPLWVGPDPMPRVPPRLSDPKVGAEAPMQDILKRIASERALAGLQPLQRSDILDREAGVDLEHYASGADPGARRTSPQGAHHYERISRGWGGALSPANWGALIAKMPFYRRAYLRPSATAIGGAARPLEDGRFGGVFALGEAPAEVDSDEVRARLTAQVDDQRARQGMRALKWSKAVTRALQKEANDLCLQLSAGGDIPQDSLREINSRLIRLPAVRRLRSPAQLQVGIRRPSGLVDLTTFLAEPEAKGARLGAVAACQGDFPHFGRGYVLILIYGVVAGSA